MIEKMAWIAPIKNMVTPKWRRLYRSGRNTGFNLVKGPMQRMICNRSKANVEVERIINVSCVASGLTINVIVINSTIYATTKPASIMS
jgi:hypothetical protein